MKALTGLVEIVIFAMILIFFEVSWGEQLLMVLVTLTGILSFYKIVVMFTGYTSDRGTYYDYLCHIPVLVVIVVVYQTCLYLLEYHYLAVFHLGIILFLNTYLNACFILIGYQMNKDK